MNRQDQWVFLDNYRRKLSLKYEVKRRLLKSLKHSRQITITQKLLASLHTSLLPQTSSPTKHNNRCVISGRNRNILKRTQSSRFIFRRFANNSVLPGLRRYSR